MFFQTLNLNAPEGKWANVCRPFSNSQCQRERVGERAERRERRIDKSLLLRKYRDCAAERGMKEIDGKKSKREQ